MSRGHPPPTPDDFYYDFNEMDFGGPANPMVGPVVSMDSVDGVDSVDMMEILNNIGPGFDPYPMLVDHTAGPALVPSYPLSFPPPMSQTMCTPIGTELSSAPLNTYQAPIPHTSLDYPSFGGQQDPSPPGTSGGGNSSSTDFTKRRNWSAKLVEEMSDLLQVLDGHGRIKYVSHSVTAMVGYQPGEIANLFLKDLLHPDDVGLFISEMNEAITSGGSMRFFYRFKRKDGTYSILEAVGHAHAAAPQFSPDPSNQTPFCQAIFLTSRPYPTKNAGLLDTFLEHKIENERLKQRIASLRMEEAEELEAQRQWMPRRDSFSEDPQTRDSSSTTVNGRMPPPQRPAVGGDSGRALTRENLEGAAAGSQPDSLRDKMARYERGSRAETIEMLTGMRYDDGERGRGGASTSSRSSPRQITGDAGIAIPFGRDARQGEKKKKQKVVEEYVCTDCGTLESPEWRKGPQGPKTLCNACGLRWAKKERKRLVMKAGEGPSTAPAGRDQPMAG